uniref:2,4-dienoyl-CoA reductase n=1 Tax=Panagrolaimus sp. ES5 TaxID=591445 RepID=A0AC34GVQ4_9BILA
MAYCKKPEKYFPIKKSPALVAGALNGKLALITGGGTGLGKAMALTMSCLGADVVIAARRLDVLEATAKEIQTKSGKEVFPIQLDIKKPELIAATYDQIEKKYGRLPNICVNNAAGNFIMATERLSPNAIKAVLDIVLLGTINMTVELGKRLIKNLDNHDGCAFLNITTPYARHGSSFVVPSATAKAGVENLVRSLAAEWGRYGMRFNVIAPGPIPTEGAWGRLSAVPIEESAAIAGQQVPLGRCGHAEELANLAAFVCSDYGSWINGSIIDFDGGQQFCGQGSAIGGTAYHEITSEGWEEIEDLIRGRTGKNKSKL